MIENTIKEKRERIGRMFQMHANNREQITEASAGDIAAIVGLKDTTTGDTLAVQSAPVMLERMIFPKPVIDISVEPKSKDDEEKMSLASIEAGRRRPVAPRQDRRRNGQTIMSGMGELHLEIIIDRMRREYGVDANIGAPQVAYRETITKSAIVDYTHKKQSGGSGQYAE